MHYFYLLFLDTHSLVQRSTLNYLTLKHGRLGFICVSIINANCDFSPRAQLLERNYYHTMIDSMHVTVLTPLCNCERGASYVTRSLLTGNNLPNPDEAGLLANITNEVNQWVEKAIAGNSRVADNGAKGKYDRQVCS